MPGPLGGEQHFRGTGRPPVWIAVSPFDDRLCWASRRRWRYVTCDGRNCGLPQLEMRDNPQGQRSQFSAPAAEGGAFAVAQLRLLDDFTFRPPTIPAECVLRINEASSIERTQSDTDCSTTFDFAQ